MSNIEVRVATNASGVAHALRIFGRDQLPFATAVSLTRAAQVGRDEVAKRLADHFHLRSKFVAKGIVVDRAEKRDWPRLVAKVGVKDEFMARHVTGGVKKPEKGATSIAVPTRAVTSQRTETGAIPKRLKPRNLRDDVAWRENEKILANVKVAAERGVRLPETFTGLDVATMFSLVRAARIRATWPVEQEVTDAARRAFPSIFERELSNAVRSARVRAGSFTSAQGRAFYLRANRRA